MNLIRKIKCAFGWCSMVQKTNSTHLWGECAQCGRMAGIVSRESVRRYIEGEERAKKFAAEQEVLRKSIVQQGKAGRP